MRRLTPTLFVLLAALALAACGGTAATASAAASSAPSTAASQPAGGADGGAACAEAPAAAAATVTVSIKDFKYAPQPVKSKVGDVVAWTNEDSAPHTASLTDGSCSTGQLAGGATGALVFNAAGTYTYQCNVHPGQMKDYTVEVE
jgi:plastocyanin